jgi:fluoroacetyl-CoA thioesterase
MVMAVAPEPGLRGEVLLTVSEADTAIALRSGDVPVLGTPRLLALCEEATVAALAGALDPGQTTVGMRVQLDHLAPTGVGGSVRAEAVLEKVEGPRLTFTVSAQDDRGLIGVGRVTRVMVDRERFLQKLGTPPDAG